MNTREAALEQIVDCENAQDVIYYIETLEEIIRLIAAGEEEGETPNQKEVYALVLNYGLEKKVS